MIDTIQEISEKKIKEYYKELKINDVVNFEKEVMLFFIDIDSENYIEIFTNIKKITISTFLNNKKIKEIKFVNLDAYYFYFLKNISIKYFIKNINFYTNGIVNYKEIIAKEHIKDIKIKKLGEKEVSNFLEENR